MTREKMIKGVIGELVNTTGGVTEGRYEKLRKVIKTLDDDELQKLRIEECADENTGVRYGNRYCRAGRCLKLGSGGRNRGERGYQVWAVWA